MRVREVVVIHVGGTRCAMLNMVDRGWKEGKGERKNVEENNSIDCKIFHCLNFLN